MHRRLDSGSFVPIVAREVVKSLDLHCYRYVRIWV